MINVTYFEAMNAFQKLDCTPDERIEIKRIISEMKNGASWKAVKYMLSLAEYPDGINAIEAHMRKTMINVTYFEAQCQNGPHRCLYGMGVRGADTPSGRVFRGANRRTHTHSGARLSGKISEACRIACSPRSGKKTKLCLK